MNAEVKSGHVTVTSGVKSRFSYDSTEKTAEDAKNAEIYQRENPVNPRNPRLFSVNSVMDAASQKPATAVENKSRLPVPAEAVQEQLARILAAPDFAHSQQLSAFLRFVVEKTLAGQEKEIKQYTVAVEALGRSPEFDPQTDPIVRITAGRLRQALAQYYETAWAQDPVLITIPKGRYIPAFQPNNIKGNHTPPAAPGQPFQLRMPQGPAVVIMPFTCQLDKPEQLYLTDGLAEQLVVTFNRFPDYLVIGPLPRKKGTAVTRDLRAVGQEYNARFVLSGCLRRQGQRYRLTVKLTDAATGGAVWADSFDNDGNPADWFAFEDRAVNRITAVLGDSFGVIPRTMAEKPAAKATEDTAVYDAILRYYHYITVYTEASRAAAFAALQQAAQIAPDYPFTLALLADMHCLEYEIFGADETILAEMERLARQAVTIDPQCQHGRFVHTLTYYYKGQKALFVQELEQAVALNPNNALILFSAGGYLTVAGEWERGAACLQKAKRLNPHYPSWVHLSAFLPAYLQGNYEKALMEAKRLNVPGVYIDPLVRAAAAGQLGKKEEGDTAVAQLLALNPDFPAQGRELMRRFFFSEKNVTALAEGLAQAGLNIR